MICRTLLVGLSASFLFAGCAAPTEDVSEDISSTEGAATTDCSNPWSNNCDAAALATTSSIAFTLSTATSDGTHVYLTGTDGKGDTITAVASTSSTAFRAAALDKFVPSDPYLPVAQNYNAILGSGVSTSDGGFLNVVTGFQGGKARVWVNKSSNTIRAFRPVPSF